MKTPQLLLSFFLAAAASSAQAANTNDMDAPAADKVAAPSADLRARRNVGLQLTYGAPGVGIWMAGGEATAFLGRDWQLNLSYALQAPRHLPFLLRQTRRRDLNPPSR